MQAYSLVLCVLMSVCRMIGDISVRRVAGKLHFAVHQQSFVDVLPQVRTSRCSASHGVSNAFDAASLLASSPCSSVSMADRITTSCFLGALTHSCLLAVDVLLKHASMQQQ